MTNGETNPRSPRYYTDSTNDDEGRTRYYTETGHHGLHRIYRPDGTPITHGFRPPRVHPSLVLTGPTLLQWRESLGLTQRALALLASVSRGVISGIETGYRSGTQEMSQALANALVEEARRQQRKREKA